MIFKESEEINHEDSCREYKTMDGKIRSKSWIRLTNGKYNLHREDGPAYINYYDDASIFYEQFFKNGHYHRLDGPAATRYFPDGSIEYERFWIDGEFIGTGEQGFWKLWDRLNKEERSNVTLIKTMMKYIQV